MFHHLVEQKKHQVIYSYCNEKKTFREILLDFISRILWQDHILLSWFALRLKFEEISLSETCLNNIFIRICKCRPHLLIALDGIDKCPDLEKVKSFLSIYHNSTTIRLLCTTASPSILSHDISWMKISIKDYHLPDFNRLMQECLKKINEKFEDPSISSKIENYLCPDTNQCK